MTVGSLFSGIGGLDLGLERAGMRVVWQSEIDPYASRVLRKHWPDVPNLGDITKIQEFPYADLICGGFPCQDISIAGNRAGLAGARSGLWAEMLRCVRMVRPRFVLVENVAALLIPDSGGRTPIATVLGDLAESGFDAEWSMLPACAFGAPHTRERVFIIAHSDQIGWTWPRPGVDGGNAIPPRYDQWKAAPNSAEWRDVQCWISKTFQNGDWESPETAIHRMDDGIPGWVDRNGYVGNAVSPVVAEWIGRRIMDAAEPVGRGE